MANSSHCLAYDCGVAARLAAVSDALDNYDVLNRLAKKTFSDSSEYSFTYTATGQVATDALSNVTSFSYGTLNRLIRQDNPDGSFLAYSYDLNGNRLSVATANGTTLYTYDALNRLSTATDSSGGISTYLYDAVGNQISIEQANGTITTSFYDTLNRLTSQVSSDSLGNPLTSFDYLLDPVGNRLQVTEVTGRLVDYTYDALYRLVSEDVTDPVNGNVLFEYTYDAVGNRLTKSVNGGVSESYAYDDNDRLLSSTTSSYHYDDNGNTLSETLSGQTTTYTYDADDRLVKAITPSDVVNFSYDTDGIRQSKSVNGLLTSYLVDKNRPYAQVLEELDNGGSVLVEYTYGADLLSQDSAITDKSYYHYDGLGSTRGLSNAAEALTDSYDYEAFGEVLSGSGSTPNSYLFAGEQLDDATGKYYLRARYYTPFNGARSVLADGYLGRRRK